MHGSSDDLRARWGITEHPAHIIAVRGLREKIIDPRGDASNEVAQRDHVGAPIQNGIILKRLDSPASHLLLPRYLLFSIEQRNGTTRGRVLAVSCARFAPHPVAAASQSPSTSSVKASPVSQ
jgi:hypothetical protein